MMKVVAVVLKKIAVSVPSKAKVKKSMEMSLMLLMVTIIITREVIIIDIIIMKNKNKCGRIDNWIKMANTSIITRKMIHEILYFFQDLFVVIFFCCWCVLRQHSTT